MLSEKQKAWNKQWDEKNLKRMSLAIPIELYTQLKEYSDNKGLTVNRAIRTAIENMIQDE